MSTEEDFVRRVSVVRERARAKFVSVGLEEGYASKLERAIWGMTLRSFPANERYWDNPRLRYRYTTKILGMAFNVSNPKNPNLKDRILHQGIPPSALARMTPSQLFPELWDPIFERVAHKQLRRQLTVDLANAPDGLLECRACKSKKTTYTQMQTRSADEPMTTFALCLNCGKRWKS